MNSGNKLGSHVSSMGTPRSEEYKMAETSMNMKETSINASLNDALKQPNF